MSRVRARVNKRLLPRSGSKAGSNLAVPSLSKRSLLPRLAVKDSSGKLRRCALSLAVASVRRGTTHSCVKPPSRPLTATNESKTLTPSSERVSECGSTGVLWDATDDQRSGASSDATSSSRLTLPPAFEVRKSDLDGACESTS